jgi:hypothetical protein
MTQRLPARACPLPPTPVGSPSSVGTSAARGCRAETAAAVGLAGPAQPRRRQPLRWLVVHDLHPHPAVLDLKLARGAGAGPTTPSQPAASDAHPARGERAERWKATVSPPVTTGVAGLRPWSAGRYRAQYGHPNLLLDPCASTGSGPRPPGPPWQTNPCTHPGSGTAGAGQGWVKGPGRRSHRPAYPCRAGRPARAVLPELSQAYLMRTRAYFWIVGRTAPLFASGAFRRRLASQVPAGLRQAWWLRRRRRAPRPAQPPGGYWQVGGATRASVKRRKRP